MSFSPPAAATSFSERCFRSVAHFRRYGCQRPPSSFGSVASLSATDSHLSNRCRSIGASKLCSAANINPLPRRLVLETNVLVGKAVRIETIRSCPAPRYRVPYDASSLWMIRSLTLLSPAACFPPRPADLSPTVTWFTVAVPHRRPLCPMSSLPPHACCNSSRDTG